MNKFCPHCCVSLLGEKIIDVFLKQGKTYDQALEWARLYKGFEEYGIENRFGREIGIYDIEKDRTVYYICPDCKEKL